MGVLQKAKPAPVICVTPKVIRRVPVRRFFHATAIANMESIFFHGQLSRNILIERNIPFVELYKYPDGKGKEVRDFSYCPYHLFCDTAFDYRIKQNYDNIPFLYISWHFTKPYRENWLLIPNHAAREKKRPLFECQNLTFKVDNEPYSLRTHALMMDQQAKPWEIVQAFHMINHSYRIVYMAEGVGPEHIPITRDCTIIIKTKQVFYKIKKWAKKHKISADVLIAPEIFEPKYKYPLF